MIFLSLSADSYFGKFLMHMIVIFLTWSVRIKKMWEFHNCYWIIIFNAWEEKISVQEFPLSEWPMGISVAIFSSTNWCGNPRSLKRVPSLDRWEYWIRNKALQSRRSKAINSVPPLSLLQFLHPWSSCLDFLVYFSQWWSITWSNKSSSPLSCFWSVFYCSNREVSQNPCSQR